jgi:hypothetical protein
MLHILALSFMAASLLSQYPSLKDALCGYSDRKLVCSLSSSRMKRGSQQEAFVVLGSRWLTPVILATQEAEIRRISTQASRASSLQDPISKKICHKVLVEWFKV